MVSAHKVHNLLHCPGRRPSPWLGDGAPSGGQLLQQQQSSREEQHLQVEGGAAGGASIVSDSKEDAAVPSAGPPPPPYTGLLDQDLKKPTLTPQETLRSPAAVWSNAF